MNESNRITLAGLADALLMIGMTFITGYQAGVIIGSIFF